MLPVLATNVARHQSVPKGAAILGGGIAAGAAVGYLTAGGLDPARAAVSGAIFGGVLSSFTAFKVALD